jgi:hypothetical protein
MPPVESATGRQFAEEDAPLFGFLEQMRPRGLKERLWSYGDMHVKV